MILLLSTGTLYTSSLEEVFDIGKETGFDGIEVLINKGFSRRHPLDKLLHLSEDILPIYTLHAPFFRLRHWRGKISALKKTVRWAGELSCQLITFHPPNWVNLEFAFWQWLRWIKDFQREVGGGRVAVAIENMPWMGARAKWSPYFWGRTQKLLLLLERKNLLLTFDCTHMGTKRPDFLKEFLLFYSTGRIRNIHLSDYRPFQQHLYPGDGILPLTRFLYLLGRLRYSGFLTVELNPRFLPQDQKEKREALKTLVEYIRGIVG